MNYRWTTYDRAATRDLIKAIRATASGHVKLIYFNDPVLIREGLTTWYSGHDDHLHIRYCEKIHPVRGLRLLTPLGLARARAAGAIMAAMADTEQHERDPRARSRARTAGAWATARRSRGSTRPAPEARDIVTLKERYGLFINGRSVPATGGDTFVSIDPSTEQPLARVAKATAADVDKAVRAARRAQRRSWGQLSGRERAKYLFRISRILQERSREFAVLESMDSGKPIKESRDVDVPLAASHFWYYAGWADKLDYAFPGRVARPLGVAAQIIPWNFPLLMLAWKIAPALAAGNTVVLKPASTTPLSAMLFAEVCVQADLPPGTVNIITGPGEIGMALATHPDVDKVAFTGSTEIGKKIGRGVAGTDKALTLELGGKAANIVFDDAPLDQAIEGIVNGIYFNQGEVCCAGSRLLVQESIAETVIDKLKDRLSTIRVGDPLDKNTDVGAINSKTQLEKITELVAVGRRRGRRPVPARLRPARPGLLLPARRCSRTSPRATASPARRSSGRCCRC